MDNPASSNLVRSLALFQLSFELGHEPSLAACIALCHRHQIPLPQWASIGILVRLDAPLDLLRLPAGDIDNLADEWFPHET